jgi:hypothetical protein
MIDSIALAEATRPADGLASGYPAGLISGLGSLADIASAPESRHLALGAGFGGSRAKHNCLPNR